MNRSEEIARLERLRDGFLAIAIRREKLSTNNSIVDKALEKAEKIENEIERLKNDE